MRHGNPHGALLGAIEAVAALLFLVPVMRVGVVGLMATIAVAFLIHSALGEFRGDLLLYGAAVLFVAVHGSLTRAQFASVINR